MNPLRLLDDDRGLTLVELMVGMAMGAIALGVIFSIFLSTQGSYYRTREFVGNQSDARVIMGMISQEIRSAGADRQGIGLERLVKCTSDSVSFQSDLNSDGVISITEPAESVTYSYDAGSGTLFRDVGDGAVPVLSKLESFAFVYLDANANPIATPLSAADRRLVRAVQIDLDIDLTSDTNRTYSTMVALRNEPTTF